MLSANKLLVSFSAFVLKGLCALYISVRVANYLGVGDFAEWSIFFSLTMLMSISDLGVGQYVLTNFARNDILDLEKRSLFGSAFFFLVLISVVLFAFSAITLLVKNKFIFEYLVLLLILLIRIPITVYSAFLQSLDKVHEKKIVEAIGYLLALLIIEWLIFHDADLLLLLIIFNLVISVSQLLIYFRARFLKCPSLSLQCFVIQPKVFSGAFPYLANNSSGLVVYGGFITIASFVLSDYQLSYVSILHGTIFMYGYQVCELVFRVNQLKFKSADFCRKMTWLYVVCSMVVFVVFTFVGQTLFEKIYVKYDFKLEDMMLFMLYLLSECYYLMRVFQMQINLHYSRLLLIISVIKTFVFFVAVVVYGVLSIQSLPVFFALLLASSGIVCLMVEYSLKRIS